MGSDEFVFVMFRLGYLLFKGPCFLMSDYYRILNVSHDEIFSSLSLGFCAFVFILICGGNGFVDLYWFCCVGLIFIKLNLNYEL